MKFKDGDRIIVKPHFWWPNGGKGVVSLPPDSVVNILKDSEKFNGVQRSIAGKDAIITSVWVDFEEPTMDCSEDGPYIGGEVKLEYLKHKNES